MYEFCCLQRSAHKVNKQHSQFYVHNTVRHRAQCVYISVFNLWSVDKIQSLFYLWLACESESHSAVSHKRHSKPRKDKPTEVDQQKKRLKYFCTRKKRNGTTNKRTKNQRLLLLFGCWCCYHHIHCKHVESPGKTVGA